MRRIRAIQGFTLLELLVAISIFAVVSAITYGGLIQVLKSRDRLEAERQFWRGLSVTFWYLQQDLGQARARSVRDTDGSPLPALRGQAVDPRALGEPSLEFTRGGMSVLSDAVRSDLQRVAYRLADGVLYRLTWASLDRAPQSKPVEAPLLQDVEAFSLRFFSDSAWSEQWPLRDGASGAAIANLIALPRGVEVKIKFLHHDEFTRTFLVNQ
ncbi:MAG TPA: type II secretion system minor pseudopilin GspJ [Acidiferrobacterales bacterium]|nr:type II secretion system minor pseudopilin GspJ [Acidiferrobacterales bacterium]